MNKDSKIVQINLVQGIRNRDLKKYIFDSFRLSKHSQKSETTFNKSIFGKGNCVYMYKSGNLNKTSCGIYNEQLLTLFKMGF